MSWLDDFGDWLEDIGDSFIGESDTEQTGTAITPGQAWLQNLLKPMIQQGVGSAVGGYGLYPTAGLPSVPFAQGYQAQGYNAPQAPYGSPSDYLGKYQDTSMNAMEQFWGGGGGGSAMGGWSGSGVDAGVEIATWAGRNAMQDYQNAMLPYAQMQNQAGQFNALAQNQASQFGVGAQNQMNMMGYTGGLQQMQNQQQSYAAPWSFGNMYPGSTGSAMVQPGQEGMSSMMPFLMMSAFM